MDSSINSIKDLENSKWMHEANKSEVAEQLPTQVLTWLNKMPVTSKIATQAMRALLLYFDGSKGGQFKEHSILILGASLLYLVSPIDAVCDFIPGIGLLDDMGVLALAMNYTKRLVQKAATLINWVSQPIELAA